MAANRRYMVVGKWYGQHWTDSDFEIWESSAAAELSLLRRDNGRLDTQVRLGEAQYGSDFHRVVSVDHTAFFADDDNDKRYIDVYTHESGYDPQIMAWKFLIADYPSYRLVLGPRGGVSKENF